MMRETVVRATCIALVFGEMKEVVFSVAKYADNHFEVLYNDGYSRQSLSDHQRLGEALQAMASAIEEEVSGLEY